MELMTANPLLDMALKYQRAGLSVIPERPRDKAPAVEWTGFQRACASAEQVRAWWGEHPDYNVGIVTGAVSRNLVVLDFDATEAFSQFCAEFPRLLATRIHHTGGGGFHCLYFVRALPSARKYTTEYGRVEVKANGTQIVAPPSVHPSGQAYSVYFPEKVLVCDGLQDVVIWLTLHSPVEARPAPRGIESNLAKSPLSKRTRDFLEHGATRGERNNALFKAACDMAGCGESEDGATLILLEACRRSGYDASFTESSARKTIRSAFRGPRIPARPAKSPSAQAALDLWAKRTGR